MVIKLIFPCENKSYLSQVPLRWGQLGNVWKVVSVVIPGRGVYQATYPRLERQTMQCVHTEKAYEN